MIHRNAPDTKFHILLHEQIRHEFTATQQYLAIAAYCEDLDLPELAKCFYGHADEERAHAMRIVRYFLDRDYGVEIPGADDVCNRFDSVRDSIALALEMERTTTRQITELVGAARDERDFMGEEFMWWFVAEQREEEAALTTLLRVAERAGDDLFHLETFVARDVAS